eukprot:g8985.t1
MVVSESSQPESMREKTEDKSSRLVKFGNVYKTVRAVLQDILSSEGGSAWYNFSIRRNHGKLIQQGERNFAERVSQASENETLKQSNSNQRLVQKETNSSNQMTNTRNQGSKDGVDGAMIGTESSDEEEDWDRIHVTITTILNDTASCVRDRLFIGSFLAEQNKDDLVKNRITHILQIGEGLTRSHEGDFVYKTLIMSDTAQTNILMAFRECIEFIDECLTSGGCLLVHCYAGVSRSPTICIAYLMWKENFTVGPAYSVVQQARTVAQPNDGFKKQLQIFESLGSDLDRLDMLIKGRTKSGRPRKKELSTDEFEIYC